jgi:hypothetical protein
MKSLADDTEILDVDPGGGESFHGRVRYIVGGEDGDDRIGIFHLILFQKRV